MELFVKIFNRNRIIDYYSSLGIYKIKDVARIYIVNIHRRIRTEKYYIKMFYNISFGLFFFIKNIIVFQAGFITNGKSGFALCIQSLLLQPYKLHNLFAKTLLSTRSLLQDH